LTPTGAPALTVNLEGSPMNKPPALNPLDAFAFLSQARIYLQRKQFDRALAALAEALRLNPQSGDALMVRATVHVEMGNFPEALADVERRLQMEPPEPVALLTRGNLRAQLGELESALVDFTEFLRQQPGVVIALRARALSLSRLRRFDEAIADLNEALRVDPASADAYLDRGKIHQDQGRYPAALADYQKALDLAPTQPRFYNQFAWMLAACPQPEYRDGARAVELARCGCEVAHWQDANLLDTLASAYAECGRFDEAIAWANKSLEQADAEIRDAVQRHVQLFRHGRPARFEGGLSSP
jgi:tetratricopeptide (TPR) repeat protein